MLGAKDLNLTINWKFKYVEYGYQCLPEPGTICADVGGKLEYGVIDHHLREVTKYESSASAIAHNPHYVLHHLLGPINDTFFSGLEIKNRELTFTYITHRNPDWDGMVSFYLCNYLVHNGTLPPDNITKALCTATDVIDQGRAKKGDNLKRPFIIYNMMCYNENNWDELIWQGCELIDDVIAHYGTKINPRIFLDPLDNTEKYRKECEQLHQDKKYFDHDLANSFNFNIYVPSHDDTLVRVDAIAFRNTPNSKMTKYWVREDTDYKVLIVPYENEGKINRVVISVDPQSKYLLPCLGYELESAETEKRAKIGMIRSGQPRFEKEYSDNEDPWYDGRNHGFTIVDSPGRGTVLTYEKIIDIIKSLYGSPDFASKSRAIYDAFICYRRNGGVEIAWALKTLLEKKGKKVFLDYASLKSGKFNIQLLESIKKTRNFIIILSPGTISRCCNEDDWVRREIKEALLHNIKILPLFTADFDPKEFENIPQEIRELANYQGITLHYEYLYAVVERINNYIEENE